VDGTPDKGAGMAAGSWIKAVPTPLLALGLLCGHTWFGAWRHEQRQSGLPDMTVTCQSRNLVTHIVRRDGLLHLAYMSASKPLLKCVVLWCRAGYSTGDPSKRGPGVYLIFIVGACLVASPPAPHAPSIKPATSLFPMHLLLLLLLLLLLFWLRCSD
jgi:hypothetical protein